MKARVNKLRRDLLYLSRTIRILNDAGHELKRQLEFVNFNH